MVGGVVKGEFPLEGLQILFYFESRVEVSSGHFDKINAKPPLYF
jgi:hypothetical protein